MKKHFINLSNGIEKIPELKGDFSFVRIRSTWCEHKRWDDLIFDLDHNLLMNLAIGNECIVYDFSKNTESYAVREGLDFIKYITARAWRLKPSKSDYTAEFDRWYKARHNNIILDKLRYYRKFAHGSEIKLTGVSEFTGNDDNPNYYAKIIKKYKKSAKKDDFNLKNLTK